MSRYAILSIALAITAGAVQPGVAGIIRDDKPDSDYTNLASDPDFAAVGVIESNNGTILRGSGVLISPEWVLTAAHFGLGAETRTFTVGGETREIIQSPKHPNWLADPVIDGGFDLRLMKLDDPIFSVTPAELPDGDEDILGQTATITGYGETGNGNTGNVAGSEGTRRAGQNILDQAGDTFNFGQGNVVYSDNVIFSDFDGPQNPGSNTPNPLFNEYTPQSGLLTLEYLAGLGDSGGGVFIDDGALWKLVAVNSVVILQNVDGGSGEFEYGDLQGVTLIAPGLDWILDTAVPSLVLGDANNDLQVTGADLISVQQNFGNVGPADGLLLGDANDDGQVTGADLISVQQNFGNTVSSAPVTSFVSAAPLPEPATVLMILALAGPILTQRRRRSMARPQ